MIVVVPSSMFVRPFLAAAGNPSKNSMNVVGLASIRSLR